MAKMKKRKLCWNASKSQQVVGYRLYWADNGEVGYDSPGATLGNVTEVVLPDGVDGFAHKGGPIQFGLAAVDELGNESDLVTFDASYQFNIPLAPEDVWIEPLDEFHTGEEAPDDAGPIIPKTLFAEGDDLGIERKASAVRPEAPDETAGHGSVQLYRYRDNKKSG